MSEHLEASHSDNTMEFAGLTTPPKIMNPEILILEDQPKMVMCHDETVSDLLDQFCCLDIVNPEILIFSQSEIEVQSEIEDQSEIFLYQDEAPSDLQGQMHSSEISNPEILIFNQSEIFLYEVEAPSDFEGQMHSSEIVNPEILIFNQLEIEDHSEIFLYQVEAPSDLEGQMHSSASQIQLSDLSRSWENQEEPEMGFVYSRPAERSHQMPHVYFLGEACLQQLHQDNALISPIGHTRHFPAQSDRDHTLMLQDSKNKKLNSSQIIFQNRHRIFASLIRSRRRRFQKLWSKARKRLIL